MPVGWFRTQLDAENAVTGPGIPWTLLRAAQFHDTVLTRGEKLAKMPVLPAPGGLRFQPVDAREVAARLVELTLGRPAGRVADIAGPEVHPVGDLLRGYLRATGRCRPLLPVHVPGKAGKAYRAGDNLALTGTLTGRRTWEDFLAERVGR
ncbi:SDR family oxidoreductase [Streptomyces sp. NPDC058646]|uniref:SDR family oxidoreductase n=1 Tax=Streptomyces sp. NPDC058646 TaxID=3346574 RepID=UPI003661B404